MMRKSVWIVLVLVSLLLAGCGPAVQTAAGPETASGEVFMLALPRLELVFDSEGYPWVLGMKVADVGLMLGADLSNLKIDKFYVDWMTAANIQHFELRAVGNGIVVFVNGKPLPYIAWDDAALKETGNFAALFNVNGELIKKFAPFVQRLGLDFAIKFPLAAGATEIPYAAEDMAALAAKAEEGPAATKLMFEIKYNERGAPAILGVSTEDLLASGISLPANLHPTSLQIVQAYNIQTLELRSKGDGLFVYVNGNPLPNIVWDNTFLGNAVELYKQMNPQSPFIGVVEQFVPMIDNADIAVMVHFPLASGAEPIPAKMH